MKNRIDQVNSVIQKELAQFLQEFLNLNIGTLATVVSVKTSVDLYYATAFMSVLPKSEEAKVMGIIQKNIREIQNHMNRRLKMKYVPQLRFKLDHTEQKQEHFEDILKKVKGPNEE